MHLTHSHLPLISVCIHCKQAVVYVNIELEHFRDDSLCNFPSTVAL